MIKIEIVHNKIEPFRSNDSHKGDGAEVVFNGRVREVEHDKKIIALEYEQYEGMAEPELQSLAEETVKKFPINDLLCSHRVGEVPVGEASLHVSIWSPHRKEALAAIEWFISQLKKRVPIWKWAIYEDGTREATSHEC
ncbi:MAG: molybdopterin biosynthesis protein MoeE [Candidatus Marinimicrobia bacterium]|nr:molybdopterin biosynthesis protein MoeE [Candidatus Neomarinimicrobiota bacterium]|tara:strand:+ start:3075 stop:3488 length:414 start_codon:yes stop_codon:yes gene_type:complete